MLCASNCAGVNWVERSFILEVLDVGIEVEELDIHVCDVCALWVASISYAPSSSACSLTSKRMMLGRLLLPASVKAARGEN